VAGLNLMGREVVRPGGAFDLDPVVVTIDVRELGIPGYQAGDWLRAERHVDVGFADACRISARIIHGDDDETGRMLVDALDSLVDGTASMDRPRRVDLPEPLSLELENAMIPRDAFFARVEQVPVAEAVGGVAAELVSPYPPGVPVLAPREVISQEAVDYLTTGVRAGMLVPDAADSSLETLRVVTE
jgi:arginine decarboxylase